MFGKDAFGRVGKYFRALRFTCEGEGKHKLVGPVAVPASCLLCILSALQEVMTWQMKASYSFTRYIRMAAVSGMNRLSLH